jgi:hypothetical protein
MIVNPAQLRSTRFQKTVQHIKTRIYLRRFSVLFRIYVISYYSNLSIPPIFGTCLFSAFASDPSSIMALPNLGGATNALGGGGAVGGFTNNLGGANGVANGLGAGGLPGGLGGATGALGGATGALGGLGSILDLNLNDPKVMATFLIDGEC